MELRSLDYSLIDDSNRTSGIACEPILPIASCFLRYSRTLVSTFFMGALLLPSWEDTSGILSLTEIDTYSGHSLTTKVLE